MTKTKAQTGEFKFVHPVSGDVFTYKDKGHSYELNGIELPGTTTPLKLVNELTWDENGKMTDKSFIIQQWALGQMEKEAIENITNLDKEQGAKMISKEKAIEFIKEAKKEPNKKFTGAGVSGTEIHAEIEEHIKHCIQHNGGYMVAEFSEYKQVTNFIEWSINNKVKFLFSEEPLYSKEWMNCGTVDFICEINGKVLIGDIKTNGDKRRYEWTGTGYDYSKPVSDIHIPALWQTGAYGKMATEDSARKLIDKFDGVVIVNIKKSGEFDESLDVRFDYNVTSLVEAYDYVIKLYKLFRNK